MAAPVYSDEPSNSFLHLLKSNGYQGWFSFDFGREKSALWKAIAHGIVLHSEIQYPEVGEFLRRGWRRKVETVLEASQPPIEQHSVEYWDAIGTAFRNLVIETFSTGGKSHVIAEIQRGMCPTPDNEHVYNTLARDLNLCLCWYENTSENGVVTHLYHSQAKGDVALFINIAQNADRLYFLYHRDVSNAPKLDFPFLMKINSCGAPLKLGSSVVKDDRDPKDKLIALLLSVAQASATFALSVADSIPPSADEDLRRLQDRVRAAEAFSVVARLGVTVLTGPLPDLLKLQAPKPLQPRIPHTVKTCELYSQEDTDFEEFHGHKFHRTCLSQYLEKLQPSFPEMPECPIDECQQKLPERALDTNSSVKDIYLQFRQAVTEKAKLQRDPLVSGPASSLPPTHTQGCYSCHRWFHAQYFLPHKCGACVECSMMALMENQDCYVCRQPFSESEKQDLFVYRERSVRISQRGI